MKKIILKREPKYDAKHEAFVFQQKAFEFCKDLPYAAIFHEQGLGKTKIGIDLMLYWLEKTDIDTVLIITKKTLISNWTQELKEHSYIKPRLLTSNHTENHFILNSPSRIIITNFETVVSEIGRIKLFCKSRNVAVLIDESTKMKTPKSSIATNLFELSDYFQKKVIMSGTPAANRPYDIWAQIYFLDKGKSLGDDFDSFKRDADLPAYSSEDAYAAVLSHIFEKIKKFTVRETKKSAKLNLPEKKYYELWTLFSQEQWKIYNKIKDDACYEIVKDGETVFDDSSQALKRLMRLLQVTSNPRILDKAYTEISGKEKVLNNLLKDIIIERREKVIIWTIYVDNAEYLYEKYKDKYKVVLHHGSLPMKKREQAIDDFKNGDAQIFIATPQSAKEGLTLTVANNAVFYDRGFSLDEYLQAQDRIHRISQTKECNIYNIMIRGSIDEWIDALLKAKTNAAALAQSDIDEEMFDMNMNYNYSAIVKKILRSKKEIPYGK